MINRRELLASFLGAAACGMSGCGSSGPHCPPGRLVGAAVELGHRLRERPVVNVHDDQLQRHAIVIVGGGMAGLAAARRLRHSGMDDFVVIELEQDLGGTSRCGQSAITGFPWGAHYVPAPPKHFSALVNLFEEVGALEGRDAWGQPIVSEICRCRYPQERVFYRGTWYDGLYLRAGASQRDLDQLARFRKEIDRWIAWRDSRGRRAFAIPMAVGSDDSEVRRLDQMSMSQWMDNHRFNSKRLRWLVQYACRDDYGTHPDQTSAWAGLFYFAARPASPGRPSPDYITWPEGNGRLVHHMSRPIARQVQCGWAVTSIRPGRVPDRPRIELRAINHAGEVRGYLAKKVIVAAPQFLAAFLLDSYRADSSAPAGSFQYGAWAVANLTLSELPKEPGLPIAWDNVLYESPSLGYVASSYQRGRDFGPALLTYYYALCDRGPGVARERLLEVDREGWAEIALSDLERPHPSIRRLVQSVDVMRWGHAMVRPAVGFIWGGTRQAAAQPIDGIHFAHSDLSGLPLFEEAFYRGTLAAEAVMRELGRTVQTVL